eukprot:scaffold294702_cov19-Tisochrysis_lutea.AAC.1
MHRQTIPHTPVHVYTQIEKTRKKMGSVLGVGTKTIGQGETLAAERKGGHHRRLDISLLLSSAMPPPICECSRPITDFWTGCLICRALCRRALRSYVCPRTGLARHQERGLRLGRSGYSQCSSCVCVMKSSCPVPLVVTDTGKNSVGGRCATRTNKDKSLPSKSAPSLPEGAAFDHAAQGGSASFLYPFVSV